MRNKFGSILLFSCGLACIPAMAESTSDQLTRIEAETMLLKARERQLDVQAKILARQEEIAARKNGNEIPISPSTSGNPVVHSIEGIGQKMFATLQLSSGALVDVKPGDMLDNGMKVVSIRANEVIIHTRQKQPMRLALLPVAPASFDMTSSSSGIRLPPPPPMPDARSAR